MTPAEQAKELFDKYHSACNATIAGTSTIFKDIAKKASLICVKEILKVYEHIDENIIKRKEEYRPLSEYDFWIEVKAILEEMK